MGDFLKQNWLWILGPLVLILLGISALVLMSQGQGDTEFHYNI